MFFTIFTKLERETKNMFDEWQSRSRRGKQCYFQCLFFFWNKFVCRNNICYFLPNESPYFNSKFHAVRYRNKIRNDACCSVSCRVRIMRAKQWLVFWSIVYCFNTKWMSLLLKWNQIPVRTHHGYFCMFVSI